MSAPVALRLAQGIPETAENFGVLRELIRVLLNDVKQRRKGGRLMSYQPTQVKRTLTFARDLADPDWSLSVPRPAKVVISQLAAAVEAVLTFHKPIESGHPQIVDPVCEGCSDVDDLQYTFYPCETVEAIENALKS